MIVRLLTVCALLLALSACSHIHTKVLARDGLDGRNNGSAGSVAAQNHIIALFQYLGVDGLSAGSGGDAYKQTFSNGTNVVGMIPGTDLAHEYVVIGAHYDHIAFCSSATLGDTICNGATDNAAGVGAALDLALYFVQPGNEPRRSVVFALWDREEDGLLGSLHYIANPLVPLSNTVAYINYDILGSNLLPSLRNVSIAVGAESGGAALVDAVETAAATQPLDINQFSAVFGQNRSDYANFIAAGIPTVFFTDSTGPCYHTSGDDPSVVDYEKLIRQTLISLELAKELASGQLTPVFDAGAPLATYGDAQSLNNLIQLALVDISRFTPAQQANITGWASTMAGIVAAGEAAFDSGDVSTMLGIALQVVSLLATGECDGFLE